MIVVADASPLILLAVVDQLSLLRHLFDEVVVPRTVYDGIVVHGDSQPGAAEVRTAEWLSIRPDPETPPDEGLNRGEAMAIALALAVHADLLLVDERKGRQSAQRAGLRVMGVVGILILAKRRQFIAALEPIITRPRDEHDWWISDALFQDALRTVGEHAQHERERRRAYSPAIHIPHANETNGTAYAVTPTG